MIPVNAKTKLAFKTDSLRKSYHLEFPAVSGRRAKTIGKNQIVGESATLTEPMCSEEQLKFGRCEACTFEIETEYEAESLQGRIFNAYLILGEEEDGDDPIPFTVGRYIVDNEEVGDGRLTKTITAYDVMYILLMLDIKSFIYSVEFPISIKNFRNQLFSYIGQEQADKDLINDNLVMVNNPFIGQEDIDMETVITGLCEINACFGHINREGKFDYISLTPVDNSELYPSANTFPSRNLYPKSIKGKNYYIDPSLIQSDISWQNYKCKSADAVQIRNSAGSVIYDYYLPGKTSYTNVYVIQNNWVVDALDSAGVQSMALNFANAISKITYTPCNANVKMDLSLEVGDAITLTGTDGTKIPTFIFSRVASGICSAFDEFEATGYEEWINDPPSTDGAINEVIDDISDLSDRVTALEQGTTEKALRIESVPSLPTAPEKNVLYLVQGRVNVV